MPYLLNSEAVSIANLRVPRYGMALAHVELQALPVPAPSPGDRSTLQLGDLSLVGTLLPGTGAFGGVFVAAWIAGAGKWDTSVSKRTYRDDGGVMLSAVLADLAADAGELSAVLDGIPDRSLGYAWTRPAGIASDLLRALVGDAWWVAPDGTTHAGPRPASTAAPSDLTVDPYDPALRRATVALPSDAVAQLLPGTTLTADGLPGPLVIGQLEVRARADHVEAVLWGERTGPELWAAVVEALGRRARFAAAYPFQVTAVAGQRATVEPQDARSADLDGHPFLDPVFGLPGASATLQPGAVVLVGWPGMDPGSPMVVGWLPGTLPASLGLSAATEINLTAPTVQLGATGGHAVVVDNGLTAWLQTVRTQLQAAGHDPGPPPGIAATKVQAV